jgi:hypothetical protein
VPSFMAVDSMCRSPSIRHARTVSRIRLQTPEFDMTSLKVDKYTHSAVPSADLVFTLWTARLPPFF